MAREVRPKFDPAADFIVHRAFICAGKQFAPGDKFDKRLVDPRRLRQMAEVTRQVKQVDAPAKPSAQATPVSAGENKLGRRRLRA